MMAEYAMRKLRVPERNVVVEAQATTTVENIANSTPLLSDSPAIKIASSTYHARRARRNLRDQSPELATRLVRARDYIPVEWGPLHTLMLVWAGYRDRRRAHASARR